MNDKIVGNNIRLKRKKQGITQTELAHKMGLNDKSSISQIEHGSLSISINRLCRIATALECEPFELLYDGSTFYKLWDKYKVAPKNVQKALEALLTLKGLPEDSP